MSASQDPYDLTFQPAFAPLGEHAAMITKHVSKVRPDTIRLSGVNIVLIGGKNHAETAEAWGWAFGRIEDSDAARRALENLFRNSNETFVSAVQVAEILWREQIHTGQRRGWNFKLGTDIATAADAAA